MSIEPTLTDPSSVPEPHENLSYPKRIGNYRILNVLGSGGMGDVYLAQQAGPLQRQVALKIIRMGRESKDVLTRFETERRALALMNHPFIAQIYEAGATEDARPYFVMELVEGQPITEFCKLNNLALEDRLWLFRRVCEAVHYAHQRGIIHRDLKPGNILVCQGKDGFAIPKVIDFGVAKAMGQLSEDLSLQTLPERVVGTLYYMSPEQMEGVDDIDIRTDVYALGVLLYELLVGQLPFDLPKQGNLLAAHKLLESLPQRPSDRIASLETGDAVSDISDPKAMARALRGDLDWITMKALDRNRDRRYGSVLEFETDIRQFMQQRPVSARPPKSSYRLWKWVQRHRLMAISGAVVLISLSGGFVASSVAYSKAETERQRAIASETAAVSALERTKRMEERASAVNQFLIDMIGESNPEDGNRDVKVLDVLTAAEESLKNDPSWTVDERASLEEALGKTFLGLGELDRSVAHLTSCMEQLGDDVIDQRQKLRVKATLGRALFELGKFEEGVVHLNDVIDPKNVDLQLDPDSKSKAHNNLSYYYMTKGDFDQAERHLRQSRDYSLLTHDERHLDVITTEANLGYLLVQKRDFVSAEPIVRRVLEVYRQDRGNSDPATMTQINNLGAILGHLGRHDEALNLVEEAYELQLRHLGENHPNTLGTINNYVTQLGKLDRYSEALPLQTKLVASAEKLFGLAHPNTITAQINLAQIQIGLKLAEEALSTLDRAEPNLSEVFPENHYRFSDLELYRAKAHSANGNHEKAVELYAKLVETSLAAELPEEIHNGYVSAYVEELTQLGRSDEATNVRERFQF